MLSPDENRIKDGLARVLGEFGRDALEPLAGSTLGARLSVWTARVIEWNQRVDLTAARTADELVDLLLADAAAIAGATEFFEKEAWVDVGTGAGAPGLALALLVPKLCVTLVEPKEKRVAFLRSVVGTLGQLEVRVVRARSDALPDKGFDVAVSRATLPPERWLPEGARLARASVWVLLARGEPVHHPGWKLEADIRYDWPLTGVARRAICYRPEAAGPR